MSHDECGASPLGTAWTVWTVWTVWTTWTTWTAWADGDEVLQHLGVERALTLTLSHPMGEGTAIG